MYFYYVKFRRRGGTPAKRLLAKGSHRRALFKREPDLRANLAAMAFYMRYRLKLPYNDIARLLEISVSTAYRWVSEIYELEFGYRPWEDFRRRPRSYKGDSRLKHMPVKSIRRMQRLYRYIATTSRYEFNLRGVMENWLRNRDEPPMRLMLIDAGDAVYAVPDCSAEAHRNLSAFMEHIRESEAAERILLLLLQDRELVPDTLARTLSLNSWLLNPAFSRSSIPNQANAQPLTLPTHSMAPSNLLIHHSTHSRQPHSDYHSSLPPPIT